MKYIYEMVVPCIIGAALALFTVYGIAVILPIVIIYMLTGIEL